MAAGTDVYTDRFSVPVQSCLYAILPSSVSHSEGKVSKQKKLLVSCGVCRCHDPDFEFWLACHCVQVSLRVSAGSGYGCPAYGILKNPVTFVFTFVRSLDAFGTAYLTEMMGSNLGWLNIPVCNLLAVGYLLILVLQVSRNNDMSEIHLDLPAKVALGGVCVLVFGLTFVTLYVNGPLMDTIKFWGFRGVIFFHFFCH